MTKRDKASIYVDAQQLLYTLYDAQFEMDKRDRLCVVPREECSHHRYNMKLFKTITHYERT